MRDAVRAAFAAVLVLVHAAYAAAGALAGGIYTLPPGIRETMKFMDVRIPLDQPEVAGRVAEQINYLLMDHRAVTLEWFDRKALNGRLVGGILEEEKCHPDLIYLCMAMGECSPSSRNRNGGVGWWALQGSKDKSDGLSLNIQQDWDDRRDPEVATRSACAIFQNLVKKYDGDPLMAIAAYTDGTAALERFTSKANGFGYWDIVTPLWAEVLAPRVVALKIIDMHKDFYGLGVTHPAATTFDSLGRVKPLKPIPLHRIAELTRTYPRLLWELNPGTEPSLGVIPAADKRAPNGYPLRTPQGAGDKVRQFLIKEGYLSN